MDTLLHLPTEIHHYILSFLTTNADLKRAALTCKDLHVVATSHIYRNVSIDISQLHTTTKCFNPRNPGLSYVRRLRINDENREYNHQKHGASLKYILKVLPRNNLEFFELATAQPVASDIAKTLRARQRLLKNYQLHPRLYNDLAEAPTSTEGLSHVRNLCLNLRTFQDCRHGAQLIRSARNLTSLSIDLDYLDDGKDTLAAGCDSSVISLKVFEILFAPSDYEISVLQRPLKRLQLKRMNLAIAGDALPNLLDFSSLEELSLISCTQPSRLLAALNDTALQLKSLVNERASDDSDAEQGSMANLLESFSGLETLRVSSDVCSSFHADYSWKTLERHSPTLRTLLIDDTKRDPFPFAQSNYDRTMGAFQQLCQKCSRLSELAIRCPGLSAKDWQRPDGFQAFLDCLKMLPSLTVLRLIAYPEHSSESKEVNAQKLRDEMQQLAGTIFANLRPHCPQLAVISVDARKQHQDCRSTRFVDRFAFVHQIGDNSSIRSVDLKKLKHLEPGCDAILGDTVWNH